MKKLSESGLSQETIDKIAEAALEAAYEVMADMIDESLDESHKTDDDDHYDMVVSVEMDVRNKIKKLLK